METIETVPAPGPSVTRRVREMKPGETFEEDIAAPDLRVLVWRVKKLFPEREYTTQKTKIGARVWRLS